MEASHRIALVPALLVAVSILVSGCGSEPPAPDTGTAGVSSAAPDDAVADEEEGQEADPAGTPPSGAPPGPPGVPPTPSSAPGNAGAGCPATDGGIPDGADTSEIEDVDGDGRADMQFFAETPRFHYGIRTASGATAVLDDHHAGPGQHRGWSARLGNGVVVTVLDDSRSATVHGFVDCRFVTTFANDGMPYRVWLKGFGDGSTGISCGDDGNRHLVKELVTEAGDDSYDIVQTAVHVSETGDTAVDGATWTHASGVPASDGRVQAAMTSSCSDVSIVASSGR